MRARCANCGSKNMINKYIEFCAYHGHLVREWIPTVCRDCGYDERDREDALGRVIEEDEQ